MSLLPWQAEAWNRIRSQVTDKKVPHGLLLSGPADSGKSEFVEHLAGYLLCSNPAEQACGECSQCQLLEAGTHPDFLTVTLEESKQIRIEQIRDMINWAQQTAQQGGRKFCLISPADRLNLQSANALLKCLEEPPADTIICLVTSEPARLLPTIRSRCQQIVTHLPPREVAIAWLQSRQMDGDLALLLDIAGGSPLRVLRTMDEEFLALRSEVAMALAALSKGQVSPIGLAASLASRDPMQVLDLAYSFILDSMKLEQAGQAPADQAGELATFVHAVPDDRRQSLLGRVCEAKSSLSGTSNANPQMLLEWVFAAA